MTTHTMAKKLDTLKLERRIGFTLGQTRVPVLPESGPNFGVQMVLFDKELLYVKVFDVI